MRGIITSFALCAAWSVASAQPLPGDTSEPAPPPPAQPTPPAAAPPAPPLPAQASTPERPPDVAFGIGVGYTFSTSLETPNTVTLRLRLPSGLAFEPILRLIHTGETTTTAGVSTNSETTEVGLGTNLIWPVWTHGRVDLGVLGQISFDTETDTPDTSMSGTNKVTTTFALGYGIELGFWITRHWMVSFDATNPIIAYSNETSNVTGGMPTKDATTTVGLINDPVVAIVVHLFD